MIIVESPIISILEKLFNNKSNRSIAYIQKQINLEEDRERVFEIPSKIHSTLFEVRSIGSGESFLEEIKLEFNQELPEKILIFPPFQSGKFLSKEFRQKYPNANLAEICLHEVIDLLPKNKILGIILPSSFFVNISSQKIRKAILEKVKINRQFKFEVQHLESA